MDGKSVGDLILNTGVSTVSAVAIKVAGDVLVARFNNGGQKPSASGEDGLSRELSVQVRDKSRGLKAGTLGVALLCSAAVFVLIWRAQGSESNAQQKIQLQSVQCQPCSVKPGDWVTVTAWLNQPVPHGSPSFMVHLNVSDGAVISGNNAIEVKPDVRSANTHFQVVRLPAYLDSIDIEATDEAGSRANTTVSVLKSGPIPGKPTVVPSQKPSNSEPKILAHNTPPPTIAAPKPAAPDPELLGRLEEAEGQLSAEEAYWQNVKSHMPPSSSIRSEITSQLYAAKSASKRCGDDRQQGDGPALKSCVDALNDHLNQLRIQH